MCRLCQILVSTCVQVSSATHHIAGGLDACHDVARILGHAGLRIHVQQRVQRLMRQPPPRGLEMSTYCKSAPVFYSYGRAPWHSTAPAAIAFMSM